MYEFSIGIYDIYVSMLILSMVLWFVGIVPTMGVNYVIFIFLGIFALWLFTKWRAFLPKVRYALAILFVLFTTIPMYFGFSIALTIYTLTFCYGIGAAYLGKSPHNAILWLCMFHSEIFKNRDYSAFSLIYLGAAYSLFLFLMLAMMKYIIVDLMIITLGGPEVTDSIKNFIFLGGSMPRISFAPLEVMIGGIAGYISGFMSSYCIAYFMGTDSFQGIDPYVSRAPDLSLHYGKLVYGAYMYIAQASLLLGIPFMLQFINWLVGMDISNILPYVVYVLMFLAYILFIAVDIFSKRRLKGDDVGIM